MLISVVNTKGGVAKTTTVMMLAFAASKQGWPVTVLDADPQGSATDWAGLVEDSDLTLPFEVLGANRASIKRTRRTPDQLVLVDTPPGISTIVQTAIDEADLVIIPTLASGSDLQRVWETLEASTHVPRAVLLSSAEQNTRAHKATLEVLEQQQAPVFSTMIPKRQALREAFGVIPTNLYHYDELWAEIQELTR